jgi:hypothetical protein
MHKGHRLIVSALMDTLFSVGASFAAGAALPS